MHRSRAKPAFTLIELLVVISIIAVLIAVLLPVLAKAKFNTRVIMCASNQKQIGVGLHVYVVENDNEYPTQCTDNLVHVYSNYSAGLGIDHRRTLIEIAANEAEHIYFCPLSWMRSEESLTTNAYSSYFFVDNTTGWNVHMITYGMYFLLHNDSGLFDWSNSETPDGPYKPLDPKAAVLGDGNGAATIDTAPTPPWSPHNTIGSTGIPTRFINSNVLYGDGRVETHGLRLEHWVRRGTSYWPW